MEVAKIPNRAISRKLISIMVAAMIFMAMAIAVVIGVSGYDNLESITRTNNDRAVNVISKEIEAITRRSDDVLKGIDQQLELKNLLVLLSTLGPYYFEEGMAGSEIEAADQIYSLQSQLALASMFKSLINSKINSIALYHLDAFNTENPAPPAFAMSLNEGGLNIAQYQKKDSSSMVASHLQAVNYMQYSNLFDVSSIYELSLRDFLDNISAQAAQVKSEAPVVDQSGKVNRLLIVDGLPVIQTTSTIELPMSNPFTWGGERANVFILVLEQIIDQQVLERLKDLLNVDIAILIDQEVKVATLVIDDSFRREQDGKVSNEGKQYFSSAKKIVFTAGIDDSKALELLVLSPVSEVVQLNFDLFIQIFLVILTFTLLMCVLFYFIIANIINTPLSALMKGVESLAYGEMRHVIEIDSDDEMGRLAQALNDMSADVHQKNALLKQSHAELEVLLEQQGKELESTQMQLIEAEKMSSLGELVAGVSHEVSTPIGICITAESFFRDEANRIQRKFNEGSMTKEDFADFIQFALDNSGILNSNLNRTALLIKNFKQVAVDQCIEDLRPLAVHAYIVDFLTTLKPRIKSYKHVIDVIGDKKLVVTTLPGALAQIITNLVMNSIIHGFDGIEKGYISIDVISEQGGAIIIYKDDGKGMPEETLQKIFDPFFTTRKGKGGTGLGMNIVYKLITDSLQGDIKCTSELGQGVQFDIFIANQEIV